MPYMTVVKKNNEVLHLSRSPGIRGWSVFTGILSIGLGILFFSNEKDSLLWKSFCCLCAILGAVLSLDDWEDCIFVKKKDILLLKRFSLVEKLIRPKSEINTVTAILSKILDVIVEEESVRFFGRAKYISLRLKDGYSLPLTIKATTSSEIGEHEKLAKVIQDFLQIDEAAQAESMLGYEEAYPSDKDSDDSSDSSDSFEHLSADVLIEEEKTEAEETIQ